MKIVKESMLIPKCNKSLSPLGIHNNLFLTHNG